MKKINEKLNNLSTKNKVLLIVLLLLIFGSLAYLITIVGDYKIEYNKQNSYCVEIFENYNLVSPPCSDFFKDSNTRQNPEEYKWQYQEVNLTDLKLN